MPKLDNQTIVRYAYLRAQKVDGKYVRPKNIAPMGVVLAKKIDGKVHFGWSKCAKRDEYTREKALSIALARLEKNRYENIATSLLPTFERLVVTAERRFDTQIKSEVFKTIQTHQNSNSPVSV